jgi:Tfp pilus assembly protein PilO
MDIHKKSIALYVACILLSALVLNLGYRFAVNQEINALNVHAINAGTKKGECKIMFTAINVRRTT